MELPGNNDQQPRTWFHSVTSACADVLRQLNLYSDDHDVIIGPGTLSALEFGTSSTSTTTVAASSSNSGAHSPAEARMRNTLRQKLAAVFISVSLELAFTEQVIIQNKTHKIWSTAREALRLLIHEAGVKALATPVSTEEQPATLIVDGVEASSASASKYTPAAMQKLSEETAAAAISSLLSACASDSSAASSGGRDSAATSAGVTAFEMIGEMSKQHEVAIIQWCSAELKRGIRMRPSFFQAVSSICSTNLEMSPDSIIDAVFNAMNDQVPTGWFQLAALFTAEAGKENLKGLLLTEEISLKIVSDHAKYVLELLDCSVVAADGGVVDVSLPLHKSFENAASAVRANLPLIQELDMFVFTRGCDEMSMRLLQRSVWKQLIKALFNEGAVVLDTCAEIKQACVKSIATTATTPAPSVSSACSSAASATAEAKVGEAGAEAAAGSKMLKNNKLLNLKDLISFSLNDCDEVLALPLPSETGLDNSELPVLEIDPEDFNMSTIRPLLAAIESELYKMAFDDDSMGAYDKLEVDITNPKQIVVKTINNSGDFFLTFAGTVSLLRRADSFALLVTWPRCLS